MEAALPPIGRITEETHQSVVTHLRDLAAEVRAINPSYIDAADSGLTIYTHGDDPAPADGAVHMNEIQTAVIGITQIQLADPVAPSLEPVETGEPGESYWAGPPEMGFMLGLPPEMVGVDPVLGQPLDPQPIPADMAKQFRDMGLAGAIPEDAVVTVDDQLTSDVYQGVFDLYWNKAGSDMFIRSNLLKNNIEGQAFALYEWDPDKRCHKMRNISVRQVYIDPEAEDIRDATYAGFDFVYDAEEAAGMYPDLADVIRENARSSGTPTQVDENTEFGGDQDRTYERPIVTLRVFWLRNQAVPLTEEEAINGQAVEIRDVPTGEVQAGVDELGVLSETPVLRQGYFAGEEEVTPDAPTWPTRKAIRQLIQIAEAGVIADDREVEHWDIPLLHNVCIQIPGKPWGQGLPERLKSMQRANNRVLDAMVKHSEYYKHPIGSMPQSVWDELQARYKKAYITPGMTMVFPDDLWQITGGKPDVFYDPPPMPPALPMLHAILKGNITQNSGRTEVLQGRAPAGVESGRALETLQQAAAGTIQFNARRTADMIRRMSLLQLWSIVKRLDVNDIFRIHSKLPLPILAKVVQRAQQIEWDVIVEISDGAAKQAARSLDLQELQVGAIDMETYRERNGIDHRQVEQRQQAMMLKQQQLAAKLAPPPGQEQQKQEKPAA